MLTTAYLLFLGSSPWIFKEKTDCSQSTSIIFDPGCTLLYMDISINAPSKNQHLSGQAVKTQLFQILITQVHGLTMQLAVNPLLHVGVSIHATKR